MRYGSRQTQKWLDFFPAVMINDMKSMGCGIDWRRSFVTTDANPFYDNFVQWQFRRLHRQGCIVKDKRYAVYSPKDGAPHYLHQNICHTIFILQSTSTGAY